MLHSKSARTEMESAPVFLSVIWLVFMLPILETESYPRPMLALAGASICTLYRCSVLQYPIQKITEIYNKITEMYKKVTELEISSWNVLFLLRSEVAYIGTEPILP
jgi:hypothetical protein